MSDQNAEQHLDTSVPHPPTDHLSEDQKKALELSGDIEHAAGSKREALTEEAEDLAGADEPAK
ncbi:MAG TPA: hypothetical protein VGO90_01855 [Chthoniobacteraceae bacterium]|jgi:hypothetical protein|nr:hypothetical protein [Chthoniobacter sp.]HEV7866399.1 hypothetical protein [Chthoniobacteraceae bacterium]